MQGFFLNNKTIVRTGAAYLAAAVFFSGVPLDSILAAPGVDIKANGSDGPVDVIVGSSFDYSWTSNDSTVCQFTGPSGVTGVTTSGSGGPIDPSHPWYPAVGSSVTLTIDCTDGAATANDSVTINIIDDVAPPPPPPPSPITVDIKAEGSDGPVTVVNGNSWNYTWTSSNATVCQLTSPSGVTGVTLSGDGGPIDPSHPWYPAVGSSVALTLDCTNGTDTAQDSVVINIVDGGGPGPSVTADIKAEGSDGPVTVVNGNSWSYTWTSSNATVCQFTSPSGVTGVTLSGDGGPIGPSHPWYPAVGSSVTLTIDCTNGTDTAQDSVVINIVDGGGPGPSISADIKINGSDTLVTINNGESWNYTWTSEDATVCQLTSPSGVTGVTLSGSGGPINPGHPWYPAVGDITTLTLDCTNGALTATDSASIRVIEPVVPVCPVPQITSGLSESVRVNNSFSYTITATTTGVTSTTTTFAATNLPAGLSFSTSTATISGSPTNTGTFNITITATTDCGTDTETLVLDVTSGGGGGGGGGGGRSRNRAPVQPGEVLGATTITDFCPFLTSYMKAGTYNDTLQVVKLQVFLKAYEKFDYVSVTGVFDAATEQAVKEFQLRYKSEVLTPWGISQPTGYVYKLTLAKINNILCGTPMPYVAPAKVAKPQVLGKEAAGYKEGGKEGMGTSTAASLPLIGNDISKGQKDKNGHEIGVYPESLAAALFTWPSDGAEMMKCLYELLLVLVVLYILGSVLESVLYKDTPENVLKRFYAKWVTFTAGLAVAWAGAYYLQEWCLLLPLLIAFIVSLAWLLTRPRHSSMKDKAKSLYLTGSARAKSMIKDKGVDNSSSTTIIIPEKK